MPLRAAWIKNSKAVAEAEFEEEEATKTAGMRPWHSNIHVCSWPKNLPNALCHSFTLILVFCKTHTRAFWCLLACILLYFFFLELVCMELLCFVSNFSCMYIIYADDHIVRVYICVCVLGNVRVCSLYLYIYICTSSLHIYSYVYVLSVWWKKNTLFCFYDRLKQTDRNVWFQFLVTLSDTTMYTPAYDSLLSCCSLCFCKHSFKYTRRMLCRRMLQRDNVCLLENENWSSKVKLRIDVCYMYSCVSLVLMRVS